MGDPHDWALSTVLCAARGVFTGPPLLARTPSVTSAGRRKQARRSGFSSRVPATKGRSQTEAPAVGPQDRPPTQLPPLSTTL